MSLTLESNDTAPIAKVVSKKRNPYFVFLDTHEPEEKKYDREPKSTYMNKKLGKSNIQQIAKSLEKLTMAELVEVLSKGESSENDEPEYFSEFRVKPSEEIEPMPSLTPERLYSAGPTGAGKTVVISKYAKNWQAIFPEYKIIIFCRQSDDKAYKGLIYEQIVLDTEEQSKLGKSLDDLAEELKEVPLDRYANSLIIFDDCDNIQNPKLLKVIHNLNNDLMCNGRKKNIWVAYIGHLMKGGQRTKVVLAESSKVFFFLGTGTRGAKGFLKDYADMENEQIKRITSIKDPYWLMLSRNFPRYIMTTKQIFLI